MLFAGLTLMRRALPVPDIFLSYSRTDLATTGKMAAALKAAGHDVWWDQALKSGEVYDQVTETALREARVVVVLWSKAAVGSDWVRSEATVAMQRGALMPVMIEDCQRPVMFELRQSADLIGWKGNAKDPRLVAFLGDVARQLATPATLQPAQIPAAPPSAGPSRRLLIGGGAALGAAALAGGGWLLLRPTAAHATNTSIAVLPFANLSGDAAQAYFSDGIAEELRSSLSRIAGLQVAARTSSELMRDADVKEAAAKLGVAHVLTGSVRKGGGTIRVATQLLNGETGLETWSQAYDRPEGDALVVQSSIATSVANALSLSLGKAAAMLGGTKNPAAYDAYLRAMALTQRDEAGFRARIAALDAAIAIDPDFAAAHARRSSALTNFFWAVGDVDLLEASGRAAARAVALAPILPDAQQALAYYKAAVLDFRGAAETYDKVLRMPDVQGESLSAIASFLAYIGRSNEALALAEKAVALDPLSALAQANRAGVLISARQGTAALAAAEASLSAYPNQNNLYLSKGRALLLLNRPGDALAAFDRVEDPRLRAAGQAIAHLRLGNRAGSDRALAVLKADYADIGAYEIAYVHAVRGEADLAFAALDHAIVTKSRGVAQLRTDFRLDSLRKDPRYAALEKRLDFPPR